MSTFDQLIITMGIHLAHIHGRDNVCILTADNRLSDVLNLCKNKQELTKSMIKKLKLDKAKEITGKPFSSELFPHHLNLSNCNKVELKNIFGIWPLNIKKKNKTYRFTRI